MTPNSWRSATVLKNQTHTTVFFQTAGDVVGRAALTNADWMWLATEILKIQPGGEVRLIFVKDEPKGT